MRVCARMLGIISTVPTRVKKIAALPWISFAFILLFLAGIVSYFSISDLSVLSLLILSFFALSPVLLLLRIEWLNRQTTGKGTERRILLGALYLGFLSLAGIARFNEEKLKNVLKSGQLTQFRMALLPGRARVPLLEDRLSNELDHIPVHLVETETFEDTIQALARGDVEAAWLGPISYLRAQSQYGGRALLRNLTLSGQKTYQSYFIAHTSANIRTLEDFKGLTLAFVDPGSTSGYLIPRYFLKKAGLDLGKSDIKIKYQGSHEEVLKRVKDKTYLAGAIESNIYEDALKRGEAKELVHIETKEKIDIPKGPLTIRKDVLHYDELRIADALLSIAETAPSIINTIGDGGYVKVKHEDYVFLLDIVKATGGDITKYD